MVYDFISSFPEEIKCIWKRKFGLGTVLYFSIRYGAVLNMLLETAAIAIFPETVLVSHEIQSKILRLNPGHRGR